MKKVGDKAIEKGRDSLSYYHYHKFNKEVWWTPQIGKERKSSSGNHREKTWTEEGARDYLKIMSYVSMAHKQGYNAYETIKNAISGHSDFIFE